MIDFMCIRSKKTRFNKIRPSVIHLMRGQVFEIDGKTYLHLAEPIAMMPGGINRPNDPDFKKEEEIGSGLVSIPGKSCELVEAELPSEEERNAGRNREPGST